MTSARFVEDTSGSIANSTPEASTLIRRLTIDTKPTDKEEEALAEAVAAATEDMEAEALEEALEEAHLESNTTNRSITIITNMIKPMLMGHHQPFTQTNPVMQRIATTACHLLLEEDGIANHITETR